MQFFGGRLVEELVDTWQIRASEFLTSYIGGNGEMALGVNSVENELVYYSGRRGKFGRDLPCIN
jgi:hypothetical protein